MSVWPSDAAPVGLSPLASRATTVGEWGIHRTQPPYSYTVERSKWAGLSLDYWTRGNVPWIMGRLTATPRRKMVGWILQRPHLVIITEWLARWKWLSAAVGFAIAAFLGILPTNTPWWLIGILILVGAGLVALPVLAEQVLLERQNQLVDYHKVRLGQVLGDVVVPVCEKIGRIALAQGAKQTRELQSSLVTMIVGTAERHLGDKRVRAMYYRLENDKLVLEHWSGRGDRPREEIVDGENEVSTRIHQMVRDCAYLPSSDLPATSKVYRSFVSVSVFVGQLPFGMLNVDSPDPDDIGEAQVDYARALAQLLGAGLAI